MLTPRGRLASVMDHCFPTVKPKTRRAMRLAALSAKLGRTVESSESLTDAEIKTLLEQWEHYQYPLSPSDAGKAEIVKLASAYQIEQGQLTMQM